MTSLSLAGMNILNTRPQLQADTLTTAIIQRGGRVINLPTIDIEPLAHNITSFIAKFDFFDIIIFMSTNAVHETMQQLAQASFKFNSTVLIAAVGLATAQALQQYAINVSLLPKQFNSEGLLAHPDLQHVAHKKILIIRGDNGRKLLDETLAQRQAIVHELIVYRRNLPTLNPTDYTKLWQQQKIDIIICTSVEGMHNLFTLLGYEASNWLTNTPWLCISQRVANEVAQRGVKSFDIAQNSDLIQALDVWRQKNKELNHD